MTSPSPHAEKRAEPVAWVDPATIETLRERRRWTTAILTDVPGENATMPLYAAPVGGVTEALVEHNDVLRSAASVAARRGAETNWDAFARAVSEVLERHHATTSAARAASGRQLDTSPAPPTPETKPDAIVQAARDLVAAKFSTFKARNGREVGIQDDHGEKCWIVTFDEMFALEAALSIQPTGGGDNG